MELLVTSKECKTCRKDVPLVLFYPTKKGKYGRSQSCIECEKRQRREEWKNNKPNRSKTQQHYNHIKSTYGLTRAQYDAMVLASNGRCSVCGSPPESKSGRLHVDHCHQTGKIRGMLCRRCNTAMGFMKDDPWRFLSAIAYISIHHGKGLIPAPKHISDLRATPINSPSQPQQMPPQQPPMA